MLAGPSCVGKGPLVEALAKLHRDEHARLAPLVVYNDRAPRPGEVDGVHYHFRSHARIEALRDDERYVVVEVRGDLHALDVEDVRRSVDDGRDAFFEGNPFVVHTLREAGVLDRFDTLSVFLSPLSRTEIERLSDPALGIDLERMVTDIQRRKLLHRTRRDKTNLALPDLENIEVRAASAYEEMRRAWRFDWVLPLHDGEGDDNWDAFYHPIGSAGAALAAFVSLLRGETPALAERWSESLLG